MKKLWKRYWAPTAIWSKKLGDAVLVAGTIVTAYLPSVTFGNPKWNDYKYVVTIVLMVIVKIATNLTVKKDATE